MNPVGDVVVICNTHNVNDSLENLRLNQEIIDLKKNHRYIVEMKRTEGVENCGRSPGNIRFEK